MNILYFISKKNWGGVNKWVIDTAKGLKEKGHNIFIIAGKNSAMVSKIPNNIEHKYINVGMDFNLNKILFILQFIKKHNIDLVITNTQKDISIAGLAAKLANIPNVRRIGSVTDIDAKKIKHKILHKYLTSCSIVPSLWIKKSLNNQFDWLHSHHIEVVYNFTEILQKREEIRIIKRNTWNIPEDSFVVGITCRLAKEKQVDKLIDYISPVMKNNNKLYLVIAGKGPEEEIIKNKIKNLECSNKIKMLGFIEDPIETAAGYDIGCLTSKYEGFPNSIVEYLSAGTPVISTNVGGINEIIYHDTNGFLIDDGDSESFRKYLNQILKDRKKLFKMSNAAQETIKSNFTKKIQISKLESFFEELVSKNK